MQLLLPVCSLDLVVALGEVGQQMSGCSCHGPVPTLLTFKTPMMS